VPQGVHRSAKQFSLFSFSDRLKKPFSLQRRPGVDQLPGTFDLLSRNLAWVTQSTAGTRLALRKAISVLADVTDVADPTWERLAEAGLTGKSLTLKRHYLAQAASGGFIKKFLKFLNGLLKSLISAIPGAEPVKELKDYIENFFDDVPEPDSGLTTLFNSGGYVPFAAP
jgi:hypothetical protein